MENKKPVPATQQPLTQQHLMAHHVHPDQIYSSQHTQIPTHVATQTSQIQPNGVMHQLLQSQYQSNMNARSPLLENRHELYGTGHNREYTRHYGANDNYNYPQSPPGQERTEIHTDQNVNHDILHNIPKGYNAEVYQDYLKRNPPKDTNQIYQNHQPTYRPNANQYGSKPYLPYSSRIGPQSNTELLRRQYNEIQQMKMQQQLHYQNQAQMHQQQKFAERQLLLQQIHGIQPPPNLQNSIYSDGSYRDLDRYSSKNDFKDYELQKDIENYGKNNEMRESDKQIRQYHDAQWQTNQPSDFREAERYRKPEDDKSKSQSPPSDFNNQIQRNNVGVVSPMKSSESSTPSVKSPSSESRRSSSGNQALRSPIAQRIPSAPVAMAGILYKQGSDGLKVWRKRWFVLSEYCLFYYKSHDEEKLLGSVLLPSYKVSACTAEDKVMRKFAFKLEHANMRTYILAALDQEAMTKWVKALTMAALMQNFIDQPQKQSDRMAVKNEDDEDAGPTYANAPPKPRRSNDGYNSPSPDMYDPNYDLLKKPASHYSQGTNNTRYQDHTNYPSSPIQDAAYTRSPQSPPQQQPQYQTKRSYDTHNLSLPLTNTITERLESNQYGSSSMYRSNPQSPYFDNRNRNHQPPQQPIQDPKTNNDANIYEQRMQRNPFLQDSAQIETPANKESQMKNTPLMTEENRLSTGYNESYPESRTESAPNASNTYNKDVYGELNRANRSGSSVNERIIERRTPDAYGRAASLAYNKEKVEDYEDIYANENEYGKTYAKSPRQHQTRDNVSISSHKQAQDQISNYTQEKTFSGPAVLRRKKMQASGIQPPMPRPHSADFLEYESKNEVLNKTVPTRTVTDPPRQPQRPKSSLDINSYYDPSSDRYYSEESYAEKMRQSAQYLQQQAMGSRNIQIPLAKYASGLAEKQLSSAYSQITNNNYEPDTAINRSSRDNVSYNSKYSDIEGLNSNWTLKEKESQKDYLNRSGSVMSDNSNVSGYVKDVNRFDPTVDGFMRSASARLPSTTEKEGEKKIQQREESMKRLLEWKQRMLQSPLTRKSTPATISLARSLNHSRQSLRSDQYKPKTYNASYNSYSSDDEEETTGTDLQIPRDTQAGRSHKMNISPIVMRPETHAPFVAQPIEKDLTEVDNKNDENTYENINCPNTNNSDYDIVPDTNDVQNYETACTENKHEGDNNSGYETHDSESESETHIEYTDNDLDEVLLASDNDNKIIEDVVFRTSNKTGDDSNEAERASEKSDTPPMRNVGEEHYLPMSPRKTSTLEPPHKTILQNLSVFDDTMPQHYEDNPYVEMSLGNEDEDMQTYEIVCVNNGKVEPVYMEVKNGTIEENELESVTLRDKSISDTASNFADTKQQTLKRVSKGDKAKEKSDCSDADDESSRDFSLDTPFNRMSISDTFRPASYYLSDSRTILHRQDSSDSEVYPPPIPSSSPPCEGLSGEALSRYILDKLDKSDIPQDSSILKMLTSENQKKINAKRKTTSLMIYGSRTSIHDTLTRGEKIRNSRASLVNEKQNFKEGPSTVHNNLIFEQNPCCSLDNDSLLNADRGSSRLSLESDISSKFDIAPSNISSEATSLGSDSMMDLNNSSEHKDIENMLKRRPLSDDSLFELTSSQLYQNHDVISNADLDKYLENLQPYSNNVGEHSYENTSFVRDSIRDDLVHSDDALPTQTVTVAHQRSSSTPVRNGSTADDKVNIGIQYSILEQHVSGYVGSQSSCSSVGLTKSPISFYCKNTDEGTLIRKNLNKVSTANKIKEFENEKLAPKPEIDTNASSTTTGFHSRESSTEHSAPYYYSDLSSQEHINVLPTSHFLKNTNLHRKLNNQRRRGPLHKKNEISHIHNPIRNNQVLMSDRSFELASTARSVSVEFLSAADKDSDIDMKNIYESTGGKSSKIPESMNLISSLGCKRSTNQKEIDESQTTDLGVLNNASMNTSSIQLSSASMSSHCSGNSSNTVYYDAEADAGAYENVFCQGEKHWDEDSVWRDNLRRVSHRHARSMDDLDTVQVETVPNRIGSDACCMHSIKRIKKCSPSKIIRNVTYVNCNIQEQVQRRKDLNLDTKCIYSEEDEKVDDNDVYVSLAEDSEQCNEQSDEGVYEQLAIGSSDSSIPVEKESQKCIADSKSTRKKFEIDRENLRQWDLMSSGLMKGRAGGAHCVGANVVVGTVHTDTATDRSSNDGIL
ncbi:PREDICTED: uncharacterized protein LOC106104179 isoform X2 [Papilio polytes]|nr:PREDICTED: uncharacterized protein LOC106104179 isoform X2 [Papilio polytes]XP_013139587.1 PREDICTED: uncharacterized protein LOC106104179 isoform X2 [Papilio polytes]